MTRHTLAAEEEAGSLSSPSLNISLNVHKPCLPLRLISHNIRYATKDPFVGEKPWPIRYPKLCSQLVFNTTGHDSPFVCLQEALYSQVKDIQKYLGSSWSYIGRGRDAKPTDGEFSPLFYRSDTWSCEREETRWLSETPKKPSKSWGASQNRIVTMGQFRHKKSGTLVVVMATHFDNKSAEARRNSAKLLIKFAVEWRSKAGEELSALLIGGDFNSPPDDPAYQVMTASGSGMLDISDLVPEERRYGNTITYTGFAPDEPPDRIDFLFIQEPRTAKVKTFGVLANIFDDGTRLSDHRAVISDLEILA